MNQHRQVVTEHLAQDLVDLCGEQFGADREVIQPQWRLIEALRTEEPGSWPFAHNVGTIPAMAWKLPSYIDGLYKYLTAPPHEAAHQHRAHSYFQKVFGDDFKVDEGRSDGYVPGHFVLELKGDPADWQAALFQGLAYHRTLDFALIVVAAHGFLAVWRVDDIPKALRDEVERESGSPSEIGRRVASRHKLKLERDKLLGQALWTFPAELLTGLFADPHRVPLKVREFETVIRDQKVERMRITTRNFTIVLREMTPFFQEPLRAVRAFYSMIFEWGAGSRVALNPNNQERAALGAVPIDGLVPDKREDFRSFAERWVVALNANERYDDFFALFDRALDEVAPDFRKTHGIFFTDQYLSRFVLALTRSHVPDLGKNYLVIDPACGSGNLVTNWKSPLELRHKVVSEIEPELLFAVERRMEYDPWHHNKFTVVPKVSEERGLNFLDVSAKTYLGTLTKYLKDSGHRPDKPLAFLCNPPYRNDDDQSVDAIEYEVHETVKAVTGEDSAKDRCHCFLAQMKLMCAGAEDSGLPGDSLMLLFTNTGWMTDRPAVKTIRSQMLSSFELVSGYLVDSKQFFDVPGRFPIAFTVWRYAGNEARLEPNRVLTLVDLTWVRRSDLMDIEWSDDSATDAACERILRDRRSIGVPFGVQRRSMLDWIGITSRDFKRSRNKGEETGAVGGLPTGDRREGNKKKYGERTGRWVGFMDDLTPCRVDRDPVVGQPWFRLDAPFMDRVRGRCLSGPPDQKGFSPTDGVSARRAFLWYALQRTFAACDYPMWANAMQLWPLSVPEAQQDRVDSIVYAIALAQNECVETAMPAGNPVVGARAAHVENPLSPVNPKSFWNMTCAPVFARGVAHPMAQTVVDAVMDLYTAWSNEFGPHPSMTVSYKASYFVGRGVLTRNAGLVQIRDYAEANRRPALKSALATVQERLRALFGTFNDMLHDESSLAYFTKSQSIAGQFVARTVRPGPARPPVPASPVAAPAVRHTSSGKKK